MEEESKLNLCSEGCIPYGWLDITKELMRAHIDTEHEFTNPTVHLRRTRSHPAMNSRTLDCL
jgi:hypothetical protein